MTIIFEVHDTTAFVLGVSIDASLFTFGSASSVTVRAPTLRPALTAPPAVAPAQRALCGGGPCLPRLRPSHGSLEGDVNVRVDGEVVRAAGEEVMLLRDADRLQPALDAACAMWLPMRLSMRADRTDFNEVVKAIFMDGLSEMQLKVADTQIRAGEHAAAKKSLESVTARNAETHEIRARAARTDTVFHRTVDSLFRAYSAARTKTTVDGHYRIDGLPEGTYAVTACPP